MLNIKNLTVSVEKKKILTSFSFNFEEGKCYGVMGPNGSGKSTLASSIMGHPSYRLQKSSIVKYKGKNIVSLDPDKRARLGIFMTFQTPLSISGVNIYQLMRYALDGQLDPVMIRHKVKKYARRLKIPENLLDRSLNADFSGGEKKKMEVLQALVLDPDFIIFDEIDTGVDVDALRSIARQINDFKRQGKTMIIITHYNRILKYVKPDKVLILIGGKLVKVGSAKLAEEVEKKGYEGLS